MSLGRQWCIGYHLHFRRQHNIKQKKLAFIKRKRRTFHLESWYLATKIDIITQNEFRASSTHTYTTTQTHCSFTLCSNMEKRKHGEAFLAESELKCLFYFCFFVQVSAPYLTLMGHYTPKQDDVSIHLDSNSASTKQKKREKKHDPVW